MQFDKPIVYCCKETDRIFLRHGPIDLFVKVDAEESGIQFGIVKLLSDEFETILPSLCQELPTLRKSIEAIMQAPKSPVGRKMYDSAFRVSQYDIVSPMISVAGSVADYICDLVDQSFKTRRIFVNNGGDIAFKLMPGAVLNVGVCDDTARPEILTTITLDAASNVGGIATSGWKGRSFSLGIADAVTVLSTTAADADAAATVIANAVDLPKSDKVSRQPANSISPDNDLGDRKITVHVEQLSKFEIESALSKGRQCALQLISAGLIHSAYLSLQGHSLVVGSAPNITQSLQQNLNISARAGKGGARHA